MIGNEFSVRQRRRETAGLQHTTEIDAHLLQKRSLHLGDRDLEHHLLFGFDRQHVDDNVGIGLEALADEDARRRLLWS